MKNLCLTTLFASSLLLPACTTTATDPGSSREELLAYGKKKAKELEELDRELNKMPRVMLDLDRALFEYFKTVHMGRDDRVVTKLQALEKILRTKTRRHFAKLILKATNPNEPGDRGVALAAIGFAEETPTTRDAVWLNKPQPGPGSVKVRKPTDFVEQALDALVTGLNDGDDYIVNQSLLGLSVLRAADSPIHVISRLVEDPKTEKNLRRTATYTLLTIQEDLVPEKRNKIRPVWIRLLSQPIGEVPAPIVVQAIRGLGLFRQPQDAKTVEPYVDHPVPLVRCATAVALGRQKHPKSHVALFKLLRPTETNENVKLGARKALASLAGGKDRGYDLKKWEQLFERK